MSLLAERIKARRKELGLTQSQLAGTNLTKAFICGVEKGRVRPSLETLVLLAERLAKPVGYFVERDNALSQKALLLALSSAWVTLKQGDYTRAAESFKEALSIAQELRDQSGEAECYVGLGATLAGLRQPDLARQNVLRGKELAEAARIPQHLVRVSQVLGIIEYHERNFRKARQHFLEGYRRFQEIGHSDSALGGILLYNIGNTYMDVGNHEEAAHWYGEALRLLEPTEDLHRIALVQVQLGVSHRENGDYDSALEHLTRAKHLLEVLEDTRLLGWVHTSIGITLLNHGDVDDAIAHLEDSLRIKEQIGDDPGRARSLTELGRALIAKRAFIEAEKALAEAERLTKKFHDVTEGARLQFVRAQLQARRGNGAEAVRLHKQAISSFKSLGMRSDLANACNALGELLLKRKRPSEAAPYLSRALREFRAEKLR